MTAAFSEVLLSEAQVMKARPWKQELTGWASVIAEADGVEVIDTQGDAISLPDLIEAEREFMAHSRHAGDNHIRLDAAGRVVKVSGHVTESLIVTPDLCRMLNLPPHTPTGWLVTMKIQDPVVWREVLAGQRLGLSIGGSGFREPL